jgi:hypothetical protein
VSATRHANAPANAPAQPLATEPHAAQADDQFPDATIITPRRRTGWFVVDPSGTRHPISNRTVFGRAPVRPATMQDAALLALTDPSKSLSKTHAVVTPTPHGLVIEDVGSTNGVIITSPDGAESTAAVGVETPLEPGSVLELGEFVLRIEHD